MYVAILMLLLSLLGTNLLAAPAPEVTINHWLLAGPFELRAPVFADTAQGQFESLLAADVTDLSNLQPREGSEFTSYPGQTLKWSRLGAEFARSPGASPHYEAAYLAAWVSTATTQNVQLKISASTASTFAVYLDGKPVDEKPQQEADAPQMTIKRVLHTGKHLLLIKSVRSPRAASWSVKADITPTAENSITLSTDPRRAPSNFSDNALFDNLSAPTISPDGKWLAIVHSHRDLKLVKESWIELYDSKSGKLIRSLRPLKSPDNPFFFPNSDKLGFTANGDSGTTLWVLNLSTGDITAALKHIVGLQKLVRSPDGQFVYYTAEADKKTDESAPSLWTALEDRMSDWTNTRKLYMASLSSGLTHEITATGDFAVDEFALSREGDKLLFTRRLSQVGRPYYSTEFWLYDIPSGKATRTLAAPFPWERRPLNLTWLPGGEQLVFSASRYTVAPGDTIPRDLIEGALWRLDVRTGKTVNLSSKENFSVAEDEGRSGMLYNEKEKSLWLQVRAGGRVPLVRCDPFAAAPKFTEISFKLPFIGDFDLSRDGTCALIASDPVSPVALYLSDSNKHTPRLISSPAKNVLPTLDMAAFDRWNFTDSLGYAIDGWLYYPPNFSPDKKWPLVVYYYGGTYPRDERFSFTYHWWAANGYVVYVLNPAGAMGYSEKFAGLHANDWGTLATRDIIEGTCKLCAAKPFIDSTKMAAYGGSYGGFITMDLATKTSMFAALVSDAGISDIASYFGGGTWGFTYGDIALPNSFPWNRPDIFAGKSPFYHADKIHTPLLLIHGLADDNVPPLESAEMFTALKVLGRDVAFARFPDEDHSIAIKFSDYVTYREMMLAWFDKYLKHEPAAWDNVKDKFAPAK
ncbi:MAG TPA: prolyl oligopeptidase family serine peptidase [bacterium]|jgi:dipeptidyl aminopeptidase/acylaminoacyl peptidase